MIGLKIVMFFWQKMGVLNIPILFKERDIKKTNTKEEMVTNLLGEHFDNGLKFYSTDKKHVFLSNYGYDFVTIDGTPYGKSPCIQAWYDEKKNAFIWNAIEGKELVVYEYKLD